MDPSTFYLSSPLPSMSLPPPAVIHNTTNVQTISSLNLLKDTQTLVQVFQGLLQLEESSKDYAVLVLTTQQQQAPPPPPLSGTPIDTAATNSSLLILLVLSSAMSGQASPATAREWDQSDQRQRSVATWVVDDAVLERLLLLTTTTFEGSTSTSLTTNNAGLTRAYSVQAGKVQDQTIALLQLSAATVMCLTPSLMGSVTGRMALAQSVRQILETGSLKRRSTANGARTPPSGTRRITDPNTTLVATASSPARSSASAAATTTTTISPRACTPKGNSSTHKRTISNGQSGKNDIKDSARVPPTKDSARVPPKFPMLNVKLLQQQGEYKPFALNTTEAQEFETDLFKGKVLILLKPTDPAQDDPYWNEKLFSKKQRRFVVQCQGKFKKQPTGTVYLGGETYTLKVGLLTRGICGILLRFIEGFVPSVVYSYGDQKKGDHKNNGKDDEPMQDLPRIVVPAHSGFDRIHVTPAGQEPPPITHEPFPESDADRKRRQKAKDWEWNTNDTYSFSFYTMYFDFFTWKLANLPVASGMNLSTFWADSPLRIVLYENDNNGTKKKQHLLNQNRYHFVLQMKYTGQADDVATDSEDEMHVSQKKESTENRSMLLNESYDEAGGEDDDYDEETSRGRVQMMEFMSDHLLEEPVEDDDDEDEFHDAEETEMEDLRDSVSLTSSITLLPFSEIQLSWMNAKIPAWIEMAGPGRNGAYARYFAINVAVHGNENKTILRLKSDCDNLLECGYRSKASAFVSRSFSSLLSQTERRRRMLAYTLFKRDSETEYSEFNKYMAGEKVFLKRENQEPSGVNVIMSGFVARALSDRHWIEEWVTLDGTGMITFRRTDKKKKSYSIRTMSILSVNILYEEDCPIFFGYSFMYIETLGRTIYLMFSDSSQRDAWHSAISELMEPQGSHTNGGGRNEYQLYSVDMPTQEYMHNSSVWDCKKRRVFNCAMFAFHGERELGRGDAAPSDPLTLVSNTLQLAVDSMNNDESAAKRREFLKSAAALKLVDLNPLPEDERLVFFLNLYHTMLMHAFLILEPPASSLSFVSLFREVAYDVGDELVSLAELEHCIIRAEMAHPAIIFSRFVIPKTSYSRLELHVSDFRINFALNSGSVSSPAQVLLYTPERLQEQLDTAVRLGVESISVTKQGPRDVVVTLPRVCQWFAQDFGGGKPVDLITKLAPYMKTADLETLRSVAWSPTKNRYDMSCITIKYEDFSFVCRPLLLAKG
ncbi:hypothetical protein ACA910_018757 [Epithemia clementina (nom. ined.)]